MRIKTEEVRRLRREKDFSQDYIAEKLGISQSQYSRMENDECSMDLGKVKAIADLLGTNPLDLLDFGDKQNFYYCNQSGNIETINNTQDFEREREAYQLQIKELKDDKEFLKQEIVLLKNLLKQK